ncbi:uncharacterized protein TNCV_1047231 [Trichonephila clavipes]|nr:uncharacterized protein TNCV_1047231 [Trichonephila clavipes]
MITNFFIPELNNHDVQEQWFQQDGATCHTARATIDLLKDTFGDRLNSRFGPVNRPPRSCDLTPLDYFLWVYAKSLVSAEDTPQTLDHLEDIIHRVIADIRPQMLEKIIENWTSRLDYIRASRDSHMPDIIFKNFPIFRQMLLKKPRSLELRLIRHNSISLSLKSHKQQKLQFCGQYFLYHNQQIAELYGRFWGNTRTIDHKPVNFGPCLRDEDYTYSGNASANFNNED